MKFMAILEATWHLQGHFIRFVGNRTMSREPTAVLFLSIKTWQWIKASITTNGQKIIAHYDLGWKCRRRVGDFSPPKRQTCQHVGAMLPTQHRPCWRHCTVSAHQTSCRCRVSNMVCVVSAHNGGAGNKMTTTTTAAAAEIQQSNRHGRGEGIVMVTTMATTT